MSSEIIFFIIVVFLCLDFVLERVLESLNSKHMSPVLPDSLKGIYEEKEYSRFQSYKRENGRLDSWSSGVGFVVMIVFLVAGGFGWYNSWVVSLTDSVVWQTILFVVGLSVVSSVLDIPFDYYATFRIEEKYGFNKTTRRVYWLDTVKELFLSLVLGGVLLALVVWFYTWAGTYFWLYAWGAVTLFSVFMAMFYSQLIVPLFNKQTPLQEGSLRDKIQAFAGKVGFKLDNIYVIDGSKRSTKANAYFTGLGPKKRVVLYDTLIDELTEEEIVAVLAHEVGHYKKRHTLRSMVVSVIQMGVLFWLFSLCVNNVALSEALGGDRVYFQLGLIAFAILYSPVNLILGIGMNVWSRSNEYEADAFAARYYEGDYLVSGLKKISVKSLSNLTPHPLYEYVYYSHPSLLKRIDAIKRIHE
jgi:STE24 endopeptidase